MILYPAIDLKDNQCVRLIQGDAHLKTIYHHDPLRVAKTFENQGATHLHIVDLNGALDGIRIHQEVIKHMVLTTQLKIQVGGGIHTLHDAKQLLDLGVEKIILGTVAIKQKALLKQLVTQYQDKIIVSVDAKNQKVMIDGWVNQTEIDVIDFCRSLQSLGVQTIVATDISKDGMLMGPAFDLYEKISSNTQLNVIASGGVTTMNDIIKLNQMGLYGAIIGKALYEQEIDLKEAITCLKKESFPV